jgi:hypothetical protein
MNRGVDAVTDLLRCAASSSGAMSAACGLDLISKLAVA